jgi:hypothetical protein
MAADFGFRASDWLDDWFVIDGCSGQPEGPAGEWRQIVQAIRERRPLGFKRVGLSIGRDWIEICSPRNAYGADDHKTIFFSECEEFCKSVEAVLALHDEEFTEGGVI